MGPLDWVRGWVERSVEVLVGYLLGAVSKVVRGVPSANFTALGLANMP